MEVVKLLVALCLGSLLMFHCNDHFHIWMDGKLGEFAVESLGEPL